MSPPEPMQTQLAIAAKAITCQLVAQPGALVGIPSSSVTVATPGGEIKLTFPANVFDNLNLSPGDAVIATIGLTKIGVQEVLPNA